MAYRIAQTKKTPHLDLWQEALVVGSGLPILPLFLKGGLYLPLDLDRIYHSTCVKQRIL